MNDKTKFYQNLIILLTVVIFIFGIVVIPLLLHIPFIKHIVRMLLSFTRNENYISAYIEFLGAIIGSFIAICGALWVQNKVDSKSELENQRKYACIVYNDLDMAFKDIIKIFRDTKQKYNIQDINNDSQVILFCEEALGRKIYLSPNWISDVAQLNNVLSRVEIERIYKYYGILVDIDHALQSGILQDVKKIYVSHICYFVSGNEKVHSDCKSILNKLESLTY